MSIWRLSDPNQGPTNPSGCGTGRVLLPPMGKWSAVLSCADRGGCEWIGRCHPHAAQSTGISDAKPASRLTSRDNGILDCTTERVRELFCRYP